MAAVDGLKLSAIVLLIATVVPHLHAAGPPTPADSEAELEGPDGVRVYVNKKGGNIRAYREMPNGTTTGQIEFFLDTLEELNANVDKINGNHKTSSFSSLDFVAVNLYNVSLALANASGVYGDCLNCSATLEKVGEGGQFSFSVCAITNNGTLYTNGEETNVTVGQLKIVFTMVDYVWSAPDEAAYLAADIVVKIPGSTCSKNYTGSGKPDIYDLGGGAIIEFSRMTYTDSNWNVMPATYPQFTPRGANNDFRVILKRFEDIAIYDPVIDLGHQSGTWSGTERMTGHLTLSMMISILLLVKLIV